VYEIVAVPILTPNTIPDVDPMDAIKTPLLLHVPPPSMSDKFDVVPLHTVVTPEIDGGVIFTVIGIVATQPVPSE
jgi:hypothetical protein